MKSKTSRKSTFFIILILILALAYSAFFVIENYYGDTRIVYAKGANDIRWGIDASGGVHYDTDMFDVHDYEQDPEKLADYGLEPLE